MKASMVHSKPVSGNKYHRLGLFDLIWETLTKVIKDAKSKF